MISNNSIWNCWKLEREKNIVEDRQSEMQDKAQLPTAYAFN